MQSQLKEWFRADCSGLCMTLLCCETQAFPGKTHGVFTLAGLTLECLVITNVPIAIVESARGKILEIGMPQRHECIKERTITQMLGSFLLFWYKARDEGRNGTTSSWVEVVGFTGHVVHGASRFQEC